MNHDSGNLKEFAPATFSFYCNAIDILQAARVPFLVGGAYALSYYTGIVRHTKDFDVFLRSAHMRKALDAFQVAGYPSRMVFTHWLGKACNGNDFVDLICCSGNGMCPVDNGWFDHAQEGEVFGATVHIAPAEEMIWQKAYIMERERFDGADVNHLIRSLGRKLDWNRLLTRFGAHWRVLLGHLVLFNFVYPDDHTSVPVWVLRTLTDRLVNEPWPPPNGMVCRGPLLSRMQYLADIERWDYSDPRLSPYGTMTEEEVTRWTDAGR
jgi:hypothetical protein